MWCDPRSFANDWCRPDVENWIFFVSAVIAYKVTFFTRLSLMKSIIYNYEAQILGDTGWKWIRVMDMEI